MIVDVNTHIWDTPDQLGRDMARRILKQVDQPWDRPDASTTAHDEAMEPVDKAFILGFESRYLGASISAKKVAGYVERNTEKFVGFAGIDPLSGGYLRAVDDALAMGHVGVTISPAAQACHPAHTRAMALYEKCEALGVPIIIHTVSHLASQAKLEFGRPYLLDEVARSFPKLRILITSAGYPWVDQTLVLAGKHEHVYTDISDIVRRPWQLYNVLLSAHQQQVMDRLLFGSDFPFCTPEQAIQTIYSVNTLTKGTPLATLPREQLRSIIERDVFAALGLSESTVEETGGVDGDGADGLAGDAEVAGRNGTGGQVIRPAVSGEAIQAVVAAGGVTPGVSESSEEAVEVYELATEGVDGSAENLDTKAVEDAASPVPVSGEGQYEIDVEEVGGADGVPVSPPAVGLTETTTASDVESIRPSDDADSADHTVEQTSDPMAALTTPDATLDAAGEVDLSGGANPSVETASAETTIIKVGGDVVVEAAGRASDGPGLTVEFEVESPLSESGGERADASESTESNEIRKAGELNQTDVEGRGADVAGQADTDETEELPNESSTRM